MPPIQQFKKSIPNYGDLHRGLLASGRSNSIQSNSEVVSSSGNGNSAPENVKERSVKPSHRMKTSDIETAKMGAYGMNSRQQQTSF